jgi:MFS family permease
MSQQTPPNGMRTFVILWVGQMISLLGSNLNGFALGVWVYQRTTSVTQFTLIGVFAAVPSLIISPIAGTLVDRWDRRRVLLVSNMLLASNTLIILFLLFNDQLTIWHIYALTMAGAIYGAFPLPARAAITPLLISKEQLGRANGLVQFGQAAVQILGPALAGVAVVTIGIQGVMVIDFLSFMAVLVSLLVVRIPRPMISAASQAAQGSLLREMRYGWDYLVARPGMLTLLLLFAISNFLLGSVVILVTPLILSISNPAGLGTVASIAGFGMLVGSIAVMIWGIPKNRILGVLGGSFIGGVCVIAGGLQPSVLLFSLAAFGFMVTVPLVGSCTTVIWQTKVAADVQGRVFALSGMVAGIAAPLSFLASGPLADRVFEPLLAVNGALAGSVGRVIGVGPGRGIGLMFIVMGTLHLIVIALSYLYPRLRNLETEVPDAITTIAPEESLTGATPVSA